MGKTTATVETAIVPLSDTYAIAQMDPQDLEDVISENLGGGAINPNALERVKVPSGGITVWMVPQLEGKAKAEEALEGVIVYWADRRAMWHKSMDEGGSPVPNCTGRQVDNVNGGKVWQGFGNRDGDGAMGPHDCSTCPYAEFGSGKNGSGKKCQEKRLIALLTEDSILPKVLYAPPTSLKPIREFFLRLASRNIPVGAVITRLELDQKQNAAGTDYAQIAPHMERRLTPEERSMIRAYSDRLRPLLEKVEETRDTSSAGGNGERSSFGGASATGVEAEEGEFEDAFAEE